jgi:hypothetical protein
VSFLGVGCVCWGNENREPCAVLYKYYPADKWGTAVHSRVIIPRKTVCEKKFDPITQRE